MKPERIVSAEEAAEMDAAFNAKLEALSGLPAGEPYHPPYLGGGGGEDMGHEHRTHWGSVVPGISYRGADPSLFGGDY